ncbi:MAG TPA: M20/M25/M40 family metallo-hydrolase [Pyrinomonadaceae bacterium]|nr:M20/M25/M40 family metallo-hydrolase [Pyrinomonadaceae bacterium]
MSRKILRSILLTLVAFLLIPGPAPAQQQTPIFSTVEQIKEDFAGVPCKDDDRLKAVKTLFEKAGAGTSDMSVEKFENVENLVVRKPGSSEETIVIGAHYDKVSEGCGAIDNWSGIVIIAHVFKTIKDLSLKKSIVFVAFGKEEKGLYGSRAMVDAIPKDKVEQYCAMINFDSFGLANPQVLDNASKTELTSLAASLAKQMNMRFSHASVERADADSSSFLKKKIPAVTLHGLSSEWASVIHSHNDKVSKVNPVSVYLGYKLALALLGQIDEASCQAYR